jgi:5-methylcytosine-specific restriction endonuclease McrA
MFVMAIDNHTSETPLKTCTKCKQEFPATLEYFHSDKSRPDGLRYWCKPCVNERTNERRAAPDQREKRNQRERDKYASNPELRATKNRRRRERMLEPGMREFNKQRMRIYLSNPENKIKHKQSIRRWKQSERGKASARDSFQRRRARLKNAEGFYTADDIELQYRAQKGKCWHCGKPLNGKYHIDHLIPLDRGGSNWPNNLVCSCEHCNTSKGTRFCQEWNGRLF